MNEILVIKVKFNENEIIRKIFYFIKTQLKNDWIHCKESHQIVISSDFCQTIRFMDELNSNFNYRQKVFKTLDLKLLKRRQINCYPTYYSFDNIISKYHKNIVSGGDPDSDPDNSGYNPYIISVVVRLNSLDYCLTIDKNWNKRILNLVVIRLKVEDSLWWLSTLGGAYSSLGEYDMKCAIKAGEISLSQLRLAVLTGDPNLMARCGIYMAFSLSQQNRRKETIKMIKRTLFPFISKIRNCDKIVISMYSSLCYRIRNKLTEL